MGSSTRAFADTVRIYSTGRPAWEATAFLQELASILDSSATGGIRISAIGYVATFTNGAFAVYTRDDNLIRVMTPGAKQRRIIRDDGARGTPIDQAFCLDDLADSLIVVCRTRRGELSVLRLDGALVSRVRIPSDGLGDRGLWIDNDGRYYHRVPVAGSPIEGPDSKLQFVRFALDGKILDTVSFESPGPRFPAAAGVLLPQAFAIVDPLGGAIWGNSSRYRLVRSVSRRDPSVLEREWVPVPLEGEERVEQRRAAESLRVRAERTEPAIVPPTKPAIRALIAGRDGKLWVSTYAPATRLVSLPRSTPSPSTAVVWRQPTTVDVFDRQGTYLAHFELPIGAELIAANGERLWVVQREVVGVSTARLVVYMLRRTR